MRKDDKLCNQNEEVVPLRRKVLNIVSIILCVILLPILLLNCILIIKGIASPDTVPSIGGNMPLIVLTESMEPEIKAGDLIACEKIDADDVKVGDVISFYDPSPYASETTVVTHRVVQVLTDEWSGKLKFVTKGDNNDRDDSFAVSQDDLVGKWTGFRIGGLGGVIMFMQSAWGIVLCIMVPLAIAVALYFINRRKKDDKQQSETEMLKAELARLKAEKEAAQKSDGANDERTVDDSSSNKN